jgi:hypothetical protein
VRCYACGAPIAEDDLVVEEVGRASYDDGRFGLEVRIVHVDCEDTQGIDAPIPAC